LESKDSTTSFLDVTQAPKGNFIFIMENILKAAKDAVAVAKSMITYYEKEVAQKQGFLEDAKVKANQLEKEYNEVLEKLGINN
jgi:hypothetical protein